MHPAVSIADWRPGFAKRADNFEDVRQRASAWRWEPGVTIWRIEDAVLLGARDLSPVQRLVLLHYVRRLNQEQLEKDIACVWPSTARIAAEVGCSQSTLRAHRKVLEARGYMVRDYNRANRPADIEAYDLAPLAARLGELEANAEAVDAEIRQRWAQAAEHVVAERGFSARAPENRRLEQSHRNESSSVRRRAAAPTARSRLLAQRSPPAAGCDDERSSTQSLRSGNHRANCSPEGASGFVRAQPGTSVRGEMVRQELQAAYQASPRLAALVGPDVVADPLSASPADVARIAAALPELLPEPERNNDQTFTWALSRHGLRAIAMLAIAIEDPDVRSPCKYFGKMASYDPLGAPDLRLNFARILKQKDCVPPIADPAPTAVSPAEVVGGPGRDDPRWLRIDAELQRRVKAGPYGAWFSAIGFHGIEDGVMQLSHRNGVAADRLRRDFVAVIQAAALAAGEDVSRVLLTVRGR